MDGDNQIGLEAIFDNSDFQKGIADYNSAVSDSSGRTEAAGASMEAVWDGLATVGAYAFEAIAVGIAAFAAELYVAVDAAMETEQVMARMEFVVGNVGERTGVASEDVLALADSLSQVVPIDDEVITQAITMGLTFDGVTKDNIEPLIKAAADLATWTGKDLPSTMKTLSMAISDPDKAMRLFRDANITLTEEEEKTMKSMGDLGDTAGVTSFILEQLSKKGITGLGEAMGDTATGKLSIMQTALGNLQESLGGGLLNSLSGVFDRITTFANNPQTVSFFTELGVRIGAFAETVLDKMPDIMTAIEGFGTWMTQNKPLIVGVLAAIGIAMLAFGYTAAAAGIAAMAGLWPIIAIMAVIGAAAALLYTAWTENWGGIRDAIEQAWAQVKPVFDKLGAWLKVNLPKAIKASSEFWNKVLLPAMKKVFAWIAANVIPALTKLVLWLGENVPKALKALGDFWTNVLLPAIKTVYNFINGDLIPAFKNLVSLISGTVKSALSTLATIWTGTLLPAIKAVWSFIQGSIIPLFNAVANLARAVLGVAINVLAGIWNNVLLPAMRAVWGFIQSSIIPIFTSVSSTINGVFSAAVRGLANLWNGTLLPAITAVRNALSPLASFLSGTLLSAFNGIKNVIQWVTDRLNELTVALNNLTLPDWLTPGSPTPLEIGLVGINQQLAQLANASLPAIQHQMNVLGTVRDVPGSSRSAAAGTITNSSQRTNNYLYGAKFSVANQGGMIEILQGLS